MKKENMFLKLMMSVMVTLFIFVGCQPRSDYLILQNEKKSLEVTTKIEQTKKIKKTKIVKSSYEYIILPQDRLKISIYKNPVITGESSGSAGNLGQDMQDTGVLVDTQGNIFLPLVNKVHIAGLTQTKAAKLITNKYKKYLRIPTVYVEVMNKKVYVIGEVNKPGPVKVEREKITLLEALAFVGGLTDAAVKDNILILGHDNQNKLYLRSVDITNFKQLSLTNMMLRPSDIVYVQPDGWKEYKVASDNFTAPFKTIADIVSPFVQLKYLSQ